MFFFWIQSLKRNNQRGVSLPPFPLTKRQRLAHVYTRGLTYLHENSSIRYRLCRNRHFSFCFRNTWICRRDVSLGCRRRNIGETFTLKNRPSECLMQHNFGDKIGIKRTSSFLSGCSMRGDWWSLPGGTICQNLGSMYSQLSRTYLPFGLPVSSTCLSIKRFTTASPSGVDTLCTFTTSRFMCSMNSSRENSSLIG